MTRILTVDDSRAIRSIVVKQVSYESLNEN